MKSGDTRPLDQLDFKNSFIGPLVVAFSFVALAIATWQKGGDLFTDFGHQLYLAWRLSEGEILYRDIPWLFGPLAHHVNAMVFKLAGVSVNNLLVANLCVITALTTAMYSLTQRVSNRLTATLVAVVTLGVFCFGHLLEEGVFNFLTPYSHDATYGLLLCVLLIWCCDSWGRTQSHIFALLVGVCTGLAMLTKIELALAAIAVVFTFFAFSRLLKLALPATPLLLLGFLAPLAAGYFYFLRFMSPGDALLAMSASFSQVFRGGHEVLLESYQLRGLGFDDWQGNLKILAQSCLLGASLSLAAFLCDFLLRRSRHKGTLALCGAFLVFALLFMKSSLIPWLDAPRFLTVLCPALLGVACYESLRSQLTQTQKLTALTALLWLTLASFLLLRLGLRARFYHYGFFLALPATAGMIVAYMYYMPRLIRQRGGDGDTFRILSAAFLLSGLFVHLRFSQHFYEERTYAIGSGADRLYLNPNAGGLDNNLLLQNLETLQKAYPAPMTLSVMPSGALVNYFMRAINPTGFPILDQNVLRIVGEEKVLKRFEETRPSLIVIVNVNEPSNGTDATQRFSESTPHLWKWISDNYTVAAEPQALPNAGLPQIYRIKAFATSVSPQQERSERLRNPSGS